MTDIKKIYPPQSQTLSIAHRGASSLAPENTLAAARKALELGADVWELDVSLTADGVPILGHDSSLERTSNVAALFPERRPWPVHEFTLGEIMQLDRGSWFIERDPFGQIAAGHVAPAELDTYAGESTPTLQEALIFTRDHDWRVNVEIKDLRGTPGDGKVVEKVVALVETLDMIERVLISSFNHRYLERVKGLNRQMATGALVFRPPSDPAALLRRLDAQAYHPRRSIVQPDIIAGLRARGYAVNIWTVNDEATMRALIQAQASGIITDFPQRLRPILDEA